VASAKTLYEQYVGSTSMLKNSDGKDAIELLPDWNDGQLFSDSNWYVVESPLSFGKDRQLRIILPDVEEYAKAHDDPADIKQSQKLIVMRSKRTGLNYAFVMMVVPALDYMLAKGDDLDENKYLLREEKLDGMVMFFTTDGKFVNAWEYLKGEITAEIISDGAAMEGFHTKSTQSNCFDTVEMYWDDFSGSWIKGYGLICGPKRLIEFKAGTPGVDTGGGSGGVNLPGLNPLPGGGNGLTPWVEPPKEEPTDPCASMKKKMASAEFTKVMNDLDGLTTGNYEAGRAYTYADGKYTFTSHDGNANDPEIQYSPSYVAKIDGFIHSHYDGLLKTFSPNDLLMPYHWFINKNGINNLNTFSLGLVTSEGTYFLFVSDLAKYMAFGKKYGDESKLKEFGWMYENIYGINDKLDDVSSMENLIKILEVSEAGLSIMKKSDSGEYSIIKRDKDGKIKIINCNR